MIIAPVPEMLRPALAIPNAALGSVMACRVFRYIKTGVIHDSICNTMRPTALRSIHQTNPTVDASKDTRHTTLAIHISRTMDVTPDVEDKSGDWGDKPSELVVNQV